MSNTNSSQQNSSKKAKQTVIETPTRQSQRSQENKTNVMHFALGMYQGKERYCIFNDRIINGAKEACRQLLEEGNVTEESKLLFERVINGEIIMWHRFGKYTNPEDKVRLNFPKAYITVPFSEAEKVLNPNNLQELKIIPVKWREQFEFLGLKSIELSDEPVLSKDSPGTLVNPQPSRAVNIPKRPIDDADDDDDNDTENSLLKDMFFTSKKIKSAGKMKQGGVSNAVASKVISKLMFMFTCIVYFCALLINAPLSIECFKIPNVHSTSLRTDSKYSEKYTCSFTDRYI